MYLTFFFNSLIFSLIVNCNAKAPLPHLEIIRAQRKMIDVPFQPKNKNDNKGRRKHMLKIETVDVPKVETVEVPEIEKLEVPEIEKVEVPEIEKVEVPEIEKTETHLHL